MVSFNKEPMVQKLLVLEKTNLELTLGSDRIALVSAASIASIVNLDGCKLGMFKNKSKFLNPFSVKFSFDN